jgi:hypothetical protein
VAELLIKAQEPWNNDDPKAPTTRTRKGDVIVVRPDGWEWGKEECLPRFIVVKTKETYEEAKKYEESLTKTVEKEVDSKMVEEQELVAVRKYNIDVSAVDAVADEVKNFEEITAVDLKAEIQEKSSG